MSLSQALNQFAQNLGRYRPRRMTTTQFGPARHRRQLAQSWTAAGRGRILRFTGIKKQWRRNHEDSAATFNPCRGLNHFNPVIDQSK